VEFFVGDYQPSEELSAILEEKSGKTTNGLSVHVGVGEKKNSQLNGYHLGDNSFKRLFSCLHM
jgi:hypothetical protein